MLTISLLTLQPRSQLLMQALKGDTVAVAKQINRGATLVGLCELFLSPSFGAFSDRVGRKPLMLLAPLLALPLKLAVVLRPSANILLIERVLGDALRSMGGATMAAICYADLYDAEVDARTVNEFSNTAAASGMVFAPLLSALLLRRSSDPRLPYIASAVIAGAHAWVARGFLEETSRIRRTGSDSGADGSSKKQPILRPVWDFVRLFTLSARCRVRACLFTLHCMLEGKILQDQASILQLSMDWAADLRSRWTAGFGLAMSAGGMLMQPLRSRLSEHGALRVCHLASLNALLALLGGRFWLALLPFSLAQQRRAASSAWLITETGHLSIGRGEAVGWVTSLRAAVDTVSAVLYQRAYRTAFKRGNPFNMFLLPIAVVALCEIIRVHMARESKAVVADRRQEP